MAIKQLDQDGIDSIYNRLVFTSKSDSVSLDKKSVVSMSNRLTDTQNYFNILETSFGNIKKLNDFKVKRDKQLALERAIEAVGPSSASGLSGLSIDFSATINGFGLLTKQLELLNEKLEELDFSSGSCDTADDDDDYDTKKKRKKSKGGRRGRRGGSRRRGSRLRIPRISAGAAIAATAAAATTFAGLYGIDSFIKSTNIGARQKQDQGIRKFGISGNNIEGYVINGKNVGGYENLPIYYKKVIDGYGANNRGGSAERARQYVKTHNPDGSPKRSAAKTERIKAPKTFDAGMSGMGASSSFIGSTNTFGGFGGGISGGGGASGSFGDRVVTDKAYNKISETSYSSRFADFLRGSISNIVAAAPMLGVAGYTVRKIGDYFFPDDVELPADAGVLDAIAKAEGTYESGYNTSLGYGKYLPGGREQNLTDKTLNQILQLGNFMRKQKGNPNSSALGRYQIVGTTLKDAAKALKLDLNTTKFTSDVQDRMAMWILKKQGFGAWEGFKSKPQYLQIAQTALKEGRLKSPMFATSGFFGSPTANFRKTSEFGYRNISYGSSDHRGIDFGAIRAGVAGDPIFAAKGGEVTAYTGYKRGYGNVVELDHGGGYKTRYAHLSSINVSIGQVVTAGQIIGLMGSTGATEVHLHFEILRNGQKINPGPLLGMGFIPDKDELARKPENRFTPEANTPFKNLFNPKRQKPRTKTVVVETPVAYPVFLGQRSGLLPKPLVAKGTSGKSTDYYSGRRR